MSPIQDERSPIDGRPATPRPKRRWPLIAFGLIGAAALAGLGVWQTQRMIEKQTVIDQMATRLDRAPQQIDGDETAERDNFTPAVAVGRFVSVGRQARFITSLRPFGPGHRVIAAFEIENGPRILVDRGFVPQMQPIPAPPFDQRTLRGVLHWPNERSAFTPDANLDAMMWFARDVPEMAAAFGAAPVMLVLTDPAAHADARWPTPAPVTIDVSNNHLSYAITWFSVSAIWIAMTVLAMTPRGGSSRRTSQRTSQMSSQRSSQRASQRASRRSSDPTVDE